MKTKILKNPPPKGGGLGDEDKKFSCDESEKIETEIIKNQILKNNNDEKTIKIISYIYAGYNLKEISDKINTSHVNVFNARERFIKEKQKDYLDETRH